MVRFLYLVKMMDGLPETVITLFMVIAFGPVYDAMGLVVLLLAGFFWTIRIKREIQQQYQNKFKNAIKSLFKRRNKYGE